VKQAILVLLAAGAFAALAFSQLQAEGAVECEACVEMEGRSACGTVAAPTRDEAQTRAVSHACGFATTGVTSSLACERREPVSLVCKER
jgi:isoaspartyl peptidase/L-asparaginase-like protein (Ntn-hydrolase superfamily)